MKQLVDLATSISFLTAPILASMIYYAVNKLDVEILGKGEKTIARVGILFLYCFSLYYLYIKLIN